MLYIDAHLSPVTQQLSNPLQLRSPLMTRLKHVPELYSSADWCYFDAPASNHNCLPTNPNYTYVPDPQPTPRSAKMVSITRFDGSGTAEQWLGILEEELPEDITPAT